jgi:hypothetical protein
LTVSSIFKLLIKYFHTPQPYRNNFLMRLILSHSKKLNDINVRRLERPWIACNKKLLMSQENLSKSYIGAVPHYRTGVGHILAEWNTGLLWSQSLGLKFAHCQLREPWNDFFGLKGFDDFMSVCSNPKFKRVLLPLISDRLEPSDSDLIKKIIIHYTRYSPCIFQLYYGQNSYHQENTSSILREKYFDRRRTDPIENWRINDLINISVHIRRPTFEDSKQASFQNTESSAYKERFIDLSFFLRICETISRVIGSERVCFNIFSLGSHSEFVEFTKFKNVYFHINKNVKETFHNIVMGDILILSPSSFSFNAGMISLGLKIAAEPWWHYIPENNKWCRLKRGFEFEDNKLISFLNKFN